MILNFLKKLWDWLTDFQLKLTFPWNFGELTKIEGIALIFYVIGTILPVFLIVELVKFLATRIPQVIARLNPMTLTVITTIISFLSGFGAAVAFIIHKIHEAHLTVRDALSMNFDSLGGGFRGFCRAAGIAVVGWGIIMVSEPAISELVKHILHVKVLVDPAGQFMATLHGWQFIGFGLLVAFGAPFFEEVMFRGFLMNALRKTFREGWFRTILQTDKNADFAANFVSSLAFAGAHLTLTGCPVLAFMGFLLAFSYQRSGSLYTSMMLHCLNNSTAVLQMYNAQMHGAVIATSLFVL